jgi:hypothetical protein
MRLSAGDRVVARVSSYGNVEKDITFTLRVAGPVCDAVCANSDCDDFSVLDSEPSPDDDSGSTAPDIVIIVLVTLLLAALVVLCLWQYTRTRQPATDQLVEPTHMDVHRRRRRHRKN